MKSEMALIIKRVAHRKMAASFYPGDIAEYKGRDYIVLWSGKTKFGPRTRLQFTDGTKDFWVATNLVTKSSGAGSQAIKPSRFTNPTRPPHRVDYSIYDTGDNDTTRPSGKCHVCNKTHKYIPCGYPGCSPGYCDECDGGGRLCRGPY